MCARRFITSKYSTHLTLHARMVIFVKRITVYKLYRMGLTFDYINIIYLAHVIHRIHWLTFYSGVFWSRAVNMQCFPTMNWLISIIMNNHRLPKSFKYHLQIKSRCFMYCTHVRKNNAMNGLHERLAILEYCKYISSSVSRIHFSHYGGIQ